VKPTAPIWVLLLALGAASALPDTAHAQFNPQGRKKARPGSAATRPKPAGASAPRAPAKPATSSASAVDGPSSDALIARYAGIVLSQPGAPFPLGRLAQLYRDRDGKLDALIADFERRVRDGGSGRYNAEVALAGLYKLEGRYEQAVQSYEHAIKEQPTRSVAVVALAQLHTDRGDKARARQRFEQALPLLSAEADKEQTLRTLLQLALDTKDYGAAKNFHRQLVQRAKGSFFVRAELGRELMLRSEYERAVAEYREVLKAATGDNRVLAPALRDLGSALAKLGKRDEALKYLEQALRAAGGQAGVRREVLELVVEVHRTDNKLRALIANLEKQAALDPDRLRVLAGLYEETGQVQRALETYRKALVRDGKDLETRLKIVQLLQLQGELDQAIAEYQALIRAAPTNPDFVFQLAEALIQRGDRETALKELRKLEARSGNDEETLAALVDFYERALEKTRAREVLQRLAQSGAQDPRHLVELGDRHWQDGDKKKAIQTWQRIRTVVPDRALAEYTLGEAYLEHDMAKEALEALREAVKLGPTKAKYRKAYALALERTGASAESRDARLRQYEDARRIWDQIAKESVDNPTQAREARQHIVTLWSLSGQLAQRMPPLERRLRGSPADLEAGRLLAEAQMRLRRPADAETTLRFIIARAKGDVTSLAQLERVLVQRRKLRDAIGVLEQLVRAEPKRAREHYQRMAEHAAELYRDDEALVYAAKAVELSPDDAAGHKKLGEMYRQRQDSERAIQSFRNALRKNDRLFPVYLELAELLISRGELDEADRLLRRVVRSSSDEELVLQAARLSMQVNVGRGTLESLERELLPLALGNPTKPLYRRLLVEIYGALTFSLVHQTKSTDAKAAAAARSKLEQIGERAVKPLLDALGDDRDTQQRIAIELLQHIRNKSAGPALLAYATGDAEPELRVRAMLAVGALADAALLAKLGELVVPRVGNAADESDPTRVAAAFAVARLQQPAARPLLGRMLHAESPTLRALGAIGLGLLRDRSASKELSQVARSLSHGPLPRAAAAFALGALQDRQHEGVLVELAESSDPTLRASAILALARLESDAAPRLIADALVSTDVELRASARAAALVFATRQYRVPETALDITEDRVDVRTLFQKLSPSGYSAEEHARALVELSGALAAASAIAVQSSPERARVVADHLLARSGKPAFAPLTRDLSAVAAPQRSQAERAAESIAEAVTPPFIALASQPASEVRVLAIRFLATRSEQSAQERVLASLQDPAEGVQHAALAALGRRRDAAALETVTRLLGSSTLWPVRVAAAEVLAGFDGSTRNARTLAALTRAALSDEYALVREAAVRALRPSAEPRAKGALERVAKADPEPRVREAARAALNGK
jgi:tetratricopeptide (TPR) repeat protein/HEAT repeat protein